MTYQIKCVIECDNLQDAYNEFQEHLDRIGIIDDCQIPQEITLKQTGLKSRFTIKKEFLSSFSNSDLSDISAL